jgi:transposase-like protein
MQGRTPRTLQDAIVYFSDPDVALEFLKDFRWPMGEVTCPRCESRENSFIATRRIWKCKGCKRQFSIKVGTVMEDSPIGLDKWLPAIWLTVNCKNGISSYELAKDLGISQKSAWFMLHRIRKALQAGSLSKLSGPVEADETFVGGKVRLMNNKTKARKLSKGKLKGGGTVGKAIVMGILERKGQARVKVLSHRRMTNISNQISENVEPGATVYADALQSYKILVGRYALEVIDHTEAYVKDQIHTNGMENFWSLFKRSLKGTYVAVEPFHLQAYADEQCYRYNNRKYSDSERFMKALERLGGRRLTFRELIGDERDSLGGWGNGRGAESAANPSRLPLWD